jgi:MFS family permease
MLGVLALLTLLPVTLPVPVLRELVQERFAVSELLTSLFMSINMIGAALCAPIAGILADRYRRRPDWITAALAVDAVCFLGLTQATSFPVFLAIRFVEGGAHIFALSLLLGLASSARPLEQRGLVMGVTGAGMLLGVAAGAPIGGILGREDPTRPLVIGICVLMIAAVLARMALRETLQPSARRPGWREIAQTVRRHRLVLVPLAFAFADRFTVGFFTTTFSLYLRRIHELPPADIGSLIAVFMLPFALLSMPLGMLSQRVSRAVMLCGGSLVYGAAVASLTAWPMPQLYFLMVFTGATAAVMFVPSMLMTTELLPDEVRTTSLGAFNAAGSLGFIAGPLTGGLVSQVVAASSGWEAGYTAAFRVAGASEVVLAVATFPVLWRWEKTRRQALRPG